VGDSIESAVAVTSESVGIDSDVAETASSPATSTTCGEPVSDKERKGVDERLPPSAVAPCLRMAVTLAIIGDGAFASALPARLWLLLVWLSQRRGGGSAVCVNAGLGSGSRDAIAIIPC
jgi:hypothetical protein